LNNHVDTVKLLVTEGADMFIKNEAGKDAVFEAAQRENEELVQWMLSQGEERQTGESMETDADDGEMEDGGTSEAVGNKTNNDAKDTL
jgi:hypothetical protein